MEHFKKMVVLPLDGSPEATANLATNTNDVPMLKETSKVEPIIASKRRNNRIQNVLKIILKLANVNGYNDEGQVRIGNSYIPSWDICQLLLYAVTPGKALTGEDEFVKLLVEANVDPELIVNERLKAKLLSNPRTTNIQKENIVVTSREKEVTPIAVSNTYKRHIEDNADEEPKRKKQLVNWTIPSSDDED